MKIKKIIIIILSINIPLILLSSFFIDIPLARWTFQYYNQPLDIYSGYLSELAISTYWLVLSALLYIFMRFILKNKLWSQRASFFFLNIVISGVFVNILKAFFAKTRPKLLRVDDIYNFEFFKIDHFYSSFPSGHTTTAFAVAISLSIIFPRYTAVFITYGILMALSRVGSMQHYLSDVIAGATLGTLVTLLLYATHKFTLRKTV